MYYNGVLKLTQAVGAVSLDAAAIPLYIGSYSGGSMMFNGNMDRLRIWNTARTQEQIVAGMNSVIDPGTTGLMAQYTFNQGVAGGDNTGVTTLYDSSEVESGKSSPIDGTLNGFALTGSSSNWVVSAAPAAVEMVDFTAAGQPGQVCLAWSTASESNSANWLVERSTTAGSGYAQIGRLPASGNNTNGARYSYTDETVRSGQTYYYRIAEQEQNGKLTYYGPVQAMAGTTATVPVKELSAWPNPFRAGLRLQCAAQSQVQVYDLTGRLVRTLKTTNGAVIWDGHNDSGLRLGPGVYFVRAIAPGGTVTRKVTKIQ
jgi:hypothetical protein